MRDLIVIIVMMMNGYLFETQLFEDLNEDGLPEWVIAVGGYGANGMSAGHLVVLQWQDGKIVNLAPGYPDGLWYTAPAGGGRAVFPEGVSVSFADVDGNGTREITVEQAQSDNWGCRWTLERIFGWNGSQYALVNSNRLAEDVRGCAIRAAEEAMWTKEYVAAIGHYERAFGLPQAKAYFVDETELGRYATARLALAYTLVGRNHDASALIATLSARSDDSPALSDLIEAVKQHAGDAAAMCRAAYEAFLFECPANTDACLGSPLHTIVGYTIENFGNPPHSPRHTFPSPEHAGCDFRFP